MNYIASLIVALFSISTPTPIPTYTFTNNVSADVGTLCPDAKYIDNINIAWTCKNCRCIPYYAELEIHDVDNGYCGVGIFETGTWDPLYFVCRRHDAMYIYQTLNDGEVLENIIKTQVQFTIGAGEAALYGLYTIGAFLIYVPIVWIVGSPIQLYRRWKGKSE